MESQKHAWGTSLQVMSAPRAAAQEARRYRWERAPLALCEEMETECDFCAPEERRGGE